MSSIFAGVARRPGRRPGASTPMPRSRRRRARSVALGCGRHEEPRVVPAGRGHRRDPVTDRGERAGVEDRVVPVDDVGEGALPAEKRAPVALEPDARRPARRRRPAPRRPPCGRAGRRPPRTTPGSPRPRTATRRECRSRRSASAGSRPWHRAINSGSASSPSTPPPGKTYAPATNAERGLRRSMNTCRSGVVANQHHGRRVPAVPPTYCRWAPVGGGHALGRRCAYA